MRKNFQRTFDLETISYFEELERALYQNCLQRSYLRVHGIGHLINFNNRALDKLCDISRYKVFYTRNVFRNFSSVYKIKSDSTIFRRKLYSFLCKMELFWNLMCTTHSYLWFMKVFFIRVVFMCGGTYICIITNNVLTLYFLKFFINILIC